MQTNHSLLYLLFTMGSLAAGECNSAEYYWKTVNGQLVAHQRHKPSTSAQTGTPTNAPDIGGRIDRISGTAHIKDEIKITRGYLSEAERLESVREQAEQSLRNSLPAEDGAAGFIQVWSDRKASPFTTPADPDFVGRYKIGQPTSGNTIADAVEKLNPPLPREDGRATMTAGNPNPNRSHPHLSYTLVAESSQGKVNVWVVEPQTLLNIFRRYGERGLSRTGVQLSEAERKHRAAQERAKSERSPEAQRAVTESQLQVQVALKVYEAHVRGHEERQELQRQTERACSSSSEACAKARDEETRWYEEALKRQTTIGRVMPHADDFDPSAIHDDTPSHIDPRSPYFNPKPPWRPSCALCELVNSSNPYLERHKSFAKELTSGMKGMHPSDFRKASRNYQR